MNDTYQCGDCRQIRESFPNRTTSDYGIYDGVKVCPSCCKARIERAMSEGKPQLFYFTDEKGGNPNRAIVTDWANNVKFPALFSVGKHNWHGVKQYSIWFRDNNRKPWFGVCMSGGMNQAFRARPVKDGPNFPIKK